MHLVQTLGLAIFPALFYATIMKHSLLPIAEDQVDPNKRARLAANPNPQCCFGMVCLSSIPCGHMVDL